MPNAATVGNAPNVQPKRGGGANQPGNQRPMPMVPFIRASAEHREPIFDTSKLMTTADQDLGVFDVTAYGYLRAITLLVTTTGGSGGSAAAAEDSPWNALKNIALTEPNGAVIAQFDSGFDLYLASKWGGYINAIGSDPLASPTFVAVNATTGGFAFMVRIPVELNCRDGLGSLPNQNSAATFKLRLTLSASTTTYSVSPVTTLPTVRVRGFLEAWDQPENQSGGAQNQTMPPAMNTTQFWTPQRYNVSAGDQTIRLTRVGNYIRNLILVYRRTAGTRANGQADFPDPMTLYLDTRPLDRIEKNNFIHQMYGRTGFGRAVSTTVPANDTAGGQNNGVFVYDFMHEFDGTLGHENRDLWLPTLGSTRLEIQGSFANAGVLTVLTNDVAIADSVFM